MGQGFGPRRRLQGAVLVRGLMIVWVAAVYVVLVVGGGIVLGRTDRPSPLLSVIATAVVAMGFEPVREALDRRLAGSAYERLARFARLVTQTVATDQVAPELAR